MSTSIITDTIRLAESYASIRGDTHPTGQDYMYAAVAAGERPDMVRATAEIAACERLNREALRRIDGLHGGTELSHARQGSQAGTRRGLIRLQDKLHRATQKRLPWN